MKGHLTIPGGFGGNDLVKIDEAIRAPVRERESFEVHMSMYLDFKKGTGEAIPRPGAVRCG
jgi:hypothetical protein